MTQVYVLTYYKVKCMEGCFLIQEYWNMKIMVFADLLTF